MSSLIARLRPRSTEGEVYRDKFVELFEPIWVGVLLVIAVLSAISFAGRREWLLGAGFPTLVAAMLFCARVICFRPHLAVGEEALVLVGVFRTRHIQLARVRKAAAADGTLKLLLIDGKEVNVPGLSLWTHAHGDCYAYIADAINLRIATAIARAAEGSS